MSRSFQVSEKLKLESMVEGFNLTNHLNGVTLNGVFGTGLYPSNPSSNFGQITAVNDSRSLQLALRLRF